MKNFNIENYKRKKSKIETTRKVISVNIEIKHHDFLQKNGLNLSHLIRDILDSLIEENKTKIKG